MVAVDNVYTYTVCIIYIYSVCSIKYIEILYVHIIYMHMIYLVYILINCIPCIPCLYYYSQQAFDSAKKDIVDYYQASLSERIAQYTRTRDCAVQKAGATGRLLL